MKPRVYQTRHGWVCGRDCDDKLTHWIAPTPQAAYQGWRSSIEARLGANVKPMTHGSIAGVSAGRAMNTVFPNEVYA